MDKEEKAQITRCVMNLREKVAGSNVQEDHILAKEFDRTINYVIKKHAEQWIIDILRNERRHLDLITAYNQRLPIDDALCTLANKLEED
jgi:hypothetical protein